MKENIRRRLDAEKRKIDQRNATSVKSGDQGPVLTGGNVKYEIAEKVSGVAHGGIGMIHRLVKKLGLAQEIDEKLELLKFHRPYHESDHVINLAYNILCGGQTLEDIELRRNDRVFLDALGARSLPDPTTAGDFCRRFAPEDVNILMDVVNATRLKVWKTQPASFTAETARIDADGTMVTTTGECKKGMDISYKGEWGYQTLVVSLANTQEPLFILNRSGNRPSHEGVTEYQQKSIDLCREAGFEDILLRGDTDFSLTEHFDDWQSQNVRFVFGYDASRRLVQWAESAPPALYQELVKKAEHAIKTKPRVRPENIKKRIVKERNYANIEIDSEELVDFHYKPSKCKNTYRMVALRKNLTTSRGEDALFDHVRYFFYITNDWSLSMEQVVQEARHRCNQENLIQQLKVGMRALHAPVNTLVANWAFMVMAALAWSLKAWAGLLLPISPRWKDRHETERHQIVRMDFRTFLAAFINIPAQIVHTGRRIVYRLLAWNRWQSAFFRLLDAL